METILFMEGHHTSCIVSVVFLDLQKIDVATLYTLFLPHMEKNA